MTPTTSLAATARPASQPPGAEDQGAPRSAALRALLDDLIAERFGVRSAAARRNRGDAVTDDGEGSP